PSFRARGAGSTESKRPPRGWPLRLRAARSMHLLNAGEQPAARAVARLDEVPYLLEAHRLGARWLAHHAREAHARPLLVLLALTPARQRAHDHHDGQCQQRNENDAAKAAAAEEIAEQAAQRESAQDATEHSPATSLLRRLCSLLLRCGLLCRLRWRRRHIALR